METFILLPLRFANCSRTLKVRECRSIWEDLPYADGSQFEEYLDLRLKSGRYASSHVPTLAELYMNCSESSGWYLDVIRPKRRAEVSMLSIVLMPCQQTIPATKPSASRSVISKGPEVPPFEDAAPS